MYGSVFFSLKHSKWWKFVQKFWELSWAYFYVAIHIFFEVMLNENVLFNFSLLQRKTIKCIIYKIHFLTLCLYINWYAEFIYFHI
ncbi:hypothetical protein N475_19315 [Pseudoalteromonas luteoviolacea DSM 6061]|uniref:Uncharacterized protein n=1 Tax=Pseudoalteromonas luteoviolacea DSM 6061 TaxID=1365250 RepID=A0A166VX52_9GAMM|nr:hypothetical protein N475_19315 [Pseudoalteromonas luteoviolacea DSM 6061]